MTGNILGDRFSVLSFGESHGKVVGVVVDGCPAGLPIKEAEIQTELDLRRPGTSLVTTMRVEEDKVEILSGVYHGFSTGAPILMLIKNKDADSRPYEVISKTPRPSHADYAASVKYAGYNDPRGGGRFSGRMTAGFVMAGAIAKKLLLSVLGIELIAYTMEIGGITMPYMDIRDIQRFRYNNEVRCPHAGTAEKMKTRILEERKKGDSLGGVVEGVGMNIPIGLGEPLFNSIDSDLSRALFSIPAVKGVEFGSGFQGTKRTGFENNDPYIISGGRIMTSKNDSGGIVGGLTNGMPLVVRVAFKPPASITKSQTTVNLETMAETTIIVPGRHDPCVVPRAVPVVESIMALVLVDHALKGGFIPPILEGKKA